MNVHDYNAIAYEIRNTLNGIAVESGSDDAKRLATSEVIILAANLADYFKNDDRQNFNYDKFTAACGFHGNDPIDYWSRSARGDI